MSRELSQLLLISYLLSIVVARQCNSQGEEPIECDDDEACCEVNGELDCCSEEDLWWVWLIAVVSLVAFGITAGFCFCFACYYFKKHEMCVFAKTPVHHIVQQVPKTEGAQPETRQAVRIAEALPNTCSGEIKLKRFSYEYGDSFSSRKYSDPPPSYPVTDV